VGQVGYSAEWNRWLYKAWLATGLAFLRRHGVAPTTVCDVGAGRGSWFPVWRALGAERIVATDRSPVAVSRLAADAVEVMDIARRDATLGHAQYHLVAAMYVLLHILDDGEFDTALANLAGLVRPGGHLVIAEPTVVGSRVPMVAQGAASRARRLERYEFPGLALQAIAAASVIANDPVERTGWTEWPERIRWGLTARLGSRFPRLVGPVVARIDPWLTAHTRWMPSAKLMLYTRPVTSDS
jgi:SAM-dependent methyltransferase